MTDYYLNKHGQTGGTGLNKLNRPSTAKGTFNHGFNNPFSQQLERERIISEERLKQRFDEGYVSKYTGAAATISGGN